LLQQYNQRPQPWQLPGLFVLEISMLPSAVHFEGLGPGAFYYRKLGFREPKKGEFYLSGAVVQAWKAPNDLTTSYQIVEPASPAYKVVRA
jgi:hypothetical protein